MSTRKKKPAAPVTKVVHFDTNEKPSVTPRLGFIPRGLKYVSQTGTSHGPFTSDSWFYEYASGDVAVESCIRSLLDEYVPDELHNNKLLLKLADTMRAATGV